MMLTLLAQRNCSHRQDSRTEKASLHLNISQTIQAITRQLLNIFRLHGANSVLQ